MIRKWLFWGLTVVLVAALAGLIFRGRQIEKQQSSPPAEIVRQSPPSPTRVLGPQDLDIVNSSMEMGPGGAALHVIEMRNHGSVSYGGILLKLVYQDRSGKSLMTRTFSPEKVVLLPGRSVKVSASMAAIPASAATFLASVQYADVVTADAMPAE